MHVANIQERLLFGVWLLFKINKYMYFASNTRQYAPTLGDMVPTISGALVFRQQ